MRKNFQKAKYQNQNEGNSHTNNVGPNVDSQYYNIPNAAKQNGECVLCKRNAVCVCQRCGDFYCSPDCQKNDWQRHRYICFPMPNLVRVSIYNSGTTNSNSVDANHLNSNLPKLTAIHYSENVEKLPDMSKSGTNVSPQQPSGKKLPLTQNRTAPTSRNAYPCLHPPTSTIPKNNSRVLLAGFRSPNRCYIRSSLEIDGFMSVAKAIDSYGKTATPLTKLPQANSYAVTHLDRTGLMYRVQVLAVQGDKIRVLFLDTGATAVRFMSDLREISDNILKLHQYTIQVQLKNVENYEMDNTFSHYLSQFEDKEYKIQTWKEGTVLFDWQNGSCLNDQIVNYASKMSVSTHDQPKRNDISAEGGIKQNKENKNSTIIDNKTEKNQIDTSQKQQDKEKDNNMNNPKSPTMANGTLQNNSSGSTPYTPVLIAPFETRMLIEGAENLDVVVVDNSCLNLGFFACISRSDINNFASIQEYLANFKDTKTEYKPSINELCIAKFEGDWYRAKVTVVQNENRYTVLYIDYTNESTVNSTDIRPYPSDLRLACTTNMCLIEGLPNDISEPLHKYLQAQIRMNSITKIDKVKSVDEPVVIVELEWLIKKMRDENIL